MATKPANKTLLADAPEEEAKKRDVQPKRRGHGTAPQRQKMKMISLFFYYIYFRFRAKNKLKKGIREWPTRIGLV